MSDLISKGELFNALETAKDKADCFAAIQAAKTVDAVPVRHGHWILRHIGAGHIWECSVCHKAPDIYITNHTNYCPYCGAKMDEED